MVKFTSAVFSLLLASGEFHYSIGRKDFPSNDWWTFFFGRWQQGSVRSHFLFFYFFVKTFTGSTFSPSKPLKATPFGMGASSSTLAMSSVQSVLAREILDSRGNPTVEVRRIHTDLSLWFVIILLASRLITCNLKKRCHRVKVHSSLQVSDMCLFVFFLKFISHKWV